MKLSKAKQDKIYDVIHDEVMKVRITIKINENITLEEIDSLLFALTNRAMEEILYA